jgi:hypothetical protein
MYFFDKDIKTAHPLGRILSVNEELIAVIVCKATAGMSCIHHSLFMGVWLILVFFLMIHRGIGCSLQWFFPKFFPRIAAELTDCNVRM